VLNKVALSVQVNMKADLHEIYAAPTRAAAEAAIDVFADKYAAKYREGGRWPDEGSRSAARLLRLPRRALGPSSYIKPDRERVRDGASSHREDKGSPFGEDRQAHGLQTCQRHCENMATIKGRKLVAQVVQGVKFQNGIEVIKMPAHHAA
jgi:putative transposase